jgi:hypothetical protein
MRFGLRSKAVEKVEEVKRVNSSDAGTIEDPENGSTESGESGSTENGGSQSGGDNIGDDNGGEDTDMN